VTEDLGFSADLRPDRKDVLLEAARRIDALAGHLGDRDPDGPDTRYGDLLRTFADEVVEFGPYPDIHEVPILELPNVDRTSAAWKAAAEQEFTFWWVRIPLLLFPRRDWSFSRLEVRVAFNPDEPTPQHRPRAFDIMPNRRFDTIMEVGSDLTIRIGADGRLTANAADLPVAAAGLPIDAQVGAGVDADARANLHLINTPTRYRVVAARVHHTDVGLDKVFWRLDGPEFFQADPPQLIVVLQVPKSAATVEMVGVMQAYRRFTLFPTRLQALIRELPAALRAFFTQGAPISARIRYDLGPAVARATAGGTP
jgi:hypothetical protein